MKTIVGSVYLFPQKDGTNYWCNITEMEEPKNISDDKPPIFLVDQYIILNYFIVQRIANILIRRSTFKKREER